MTMPLSFWQESIGFPLLSVMTLLPLLGLLISSNLSSLKWVKGIAYCVVLANVMLSFFLLSFFDENKLGFQFVEQYSGIGLSYSVGIDGLNILFLPLICSIALLALIFQATLQEAEQRRLILILLGHEAILIAAFCALNIMQFWLLTAIELIPLFAVINKSPDSLNKRHLRVIIGQYFGASLFMTLCGFSLLAFGLVGSEHDLSFDLITLVTNNTYLHDETLIFILLFYGFAVRIPVFPFHGWLPLVLRQEKVTTIAVFLIGLKLGVYAILRFICPLVPGVTEQWATFVMILSVVSIFYGALLGYMQNNINCLIAFMIVSQGGILVLGIFSFNAEALEGSLLLSPVYGLASIGMLLSMTMVYQKTNTALIPRLGGLLHSYPALAILFLVTALSSITLLWTIGYDTRQLLLEGVIKEHDWLVAIGLLAGHVLTAGYLLWAYQRIFLTPSKRIVFYSNNDNGKHHELIITLIICALLMGSGSFSMSLSNLINKTVEVSINQYPVHSTQHNVEEPLQDDAVEYKDVP